MVIVSLELVLFYEKHDITNLTVVVHSRSGCLFFILQRFACVVAGRSGLASSLHAAETGCPMRARCSLYRSMIMAPLPLMMMPSYVSDEVSYGHNYAVVTCAGYHVSIVHLGEAGTKHAQAFAFLSISD